MAPRVSPSTVTLAEVTRWMRESMGRPDWGLGIGTGCGITLPVLPSRAQRGISPSRWNKIPRCARDDKTGGMTRRGNDKTGVAAWQRTEEHTSALQLIMRH